MKALAAAAATTILLAPLGAAAGFAGGFRPGAVGCPDVGSPTGSLATSPNRPASLAVDGAVPASLSAVDARGTTVILGRRQLQRAAVIIATGQAEGIPAQGQVVALMAALTESSLRVLANTSRYPDSASFPHDGDGSDHDSLGLFQQRPTAGWGTVADLMDPVWSTRAFYGGPGSPTHGSPRGLLDVDGWQTMPPDEAAQAVQVSAYPGRYADNEPVAQRIMATLTGRAPALASQDCAGPGAVTLPADLPAELPAGFAGAFIAAAASQIGTPYVWGGGNFDGPTGGGFDCSGLVLYAAYQATGGRLRLPHFTGDQIRLGRSVAWEAKQPGDLIFFTYPGATGPHHVAIYLGGNRILQAPRTGDQVRYGTVGEFADEVMTVRRLV